MDINQALEEGKSDYRFSDGTSASTNGLNRLGSHNKQSIKNLQIDKNGTMGGGESQMGFQMLSELIELAGVKNASELVQAFKKISKEKRVRILLIIQILVLS